MVSVQSFSGLLQRVVHGQLLQHLCLAGFADFPCQEHFIDNCVDLKHPRRLHLTLRIDCSHLVEVEDKVQFTNIVEVLIENLYKVVDGLQVVKVVVSDIHADTKVEASIAPVDNLEVSKLHKIQFS